MQANTQEQSCPTASYLSQSPCPAQNYFTLPWLQILLPATASVEQQNAMTARGLSATACGPAARGRGIACQLKQDSLPALVP